MALKILHTADLHLGMKFKDYGSNTASALFRARLEVIDSLIEKANKNQCNILAITGDLFDRVSVKKSLVRQAITRLSSFNGEVVLILPGNHDYINESSNLWSSVRDELPEEFLILDKEEPVYLQELGLNRVVVYPAPCPERTNSDNQLSWIKEKSDLIDRDMINLGLAHGSLEGEAPEGDNYYHMKKDELNGLGGIDVWLLGHIHQPYPQKEETTASRIFMPGTPEPDGMNCRHSGSAWLIEIEKDKSVYARALKTGEFKFREESRKINSEAELESLLEEYKDNQHTLLRLKLEGTLPEEVYRTYIEGAENQIYETLKSHVFYLELENELRPQISKELIEREFKKNSIPYLLLERLENEDDLTLQLAYDLIREVQE